MPVTTDNLETLFGDHAIDEACVWARSVRARASAQYFQIREAAKYLTRVILDTTPFCADQQAAIRHVREACMTAIAAIATKGAV